MDVQTSYHCVNVLIVSVSGFNEEMQLFVNINHFPRLRCFFRWSFHLRQEGKVMQGLAGAQDNQVGYVLSWVCLIFPEVY